MEEHSHNTASIKNSYELVIRSYIQRYLRYFNSGNLIQANIEKEALLNYVKREKTEQKRIALATELDKFSQENAPRKLKQLYHILESLPSYQNHPKYHIIFALEQELSSIETVPDENKNIVDLERSIEIIDQLVKSLEEDIRQKTQKNEKENQRNNPEKKKTDEIEQDGATQFSEAKEPDKKIIERIVEFKGRREHLSNLLEKFFLEGQEPLLSEEEKRFLQKEKISSSEKKKIYYNPIFLEYIRPEALAKEILDRMSVTKYQKYGKTISHLELSLKSYSKKTRKTLETHKSEIKIIDDLFVVYKDYRDKVLDSNKKTVSFKDDQTTLIGYRIDLLYGRKKFLTEAIQKISDSGTLFPAASQEEFERLLKNSPFLSDKQKNEKEKSLEKDLSLLFDSFEKKEFIFIFQKNVYFHLEKLITAINTLYDKFCENERKCFSKRNFDFIATLNIFEWGLTALFRTVSLDELRLLDFLLFHYTRNFYGALGFVSQNIEKFSRDFSQNSSALAQDEEECGKIVSSVHEKFQRVLNALKVALEEKQFSSYFSLPSKKIKQQNSIQVEELTLFEELSQIEKSSQIEKKTHDAIASLIASEIKKQAEIKKIAVETALNQIFQGVDHAFLLEGNSNPNVFFEMIENLDIPKQDSFDEKIKALEVFLFSVFKEVETDKLLQLKKLLLDEKVKDFFGALKFFNEKINDEWDESLKVRLCGQDLSFSNEEEEKIYIESFSFILTKILQLPLILDQELTSREVDLTEVYYSNIRSVDAILESYQDAIFLNLEKVTDKIKSREKKRLNALFNRRYKEIKDAFLPEKKPEPQESADPMLLFKALELSSFSDFKKIKSEQLFSLKILLNNEEIRNFFGALQFFNEKIKGEWDERLRESLEDQSLSFDTQEEKIEIYSSAIDFMLTNSSRLPLILSQAWASREVLLTNCEDPFKIVYYSDICSIDAISESYQNAIVLNLKKIVKELKLKKSLNECAQDSKEMEDDGSETNENSLCSRDLTSNDGDSLSGSSDSSIISGVDTVFSPLGSGSIMSPPSQNNSETNEYPDDSVLNDCDSSIISGIDNTNSEQLSPPFVSPSADSTPNNYNPSQFFLGNSPPPTEKKSLEKTEPPILRTPL